MAGTTKAVAKPFGSSLQINSVGELMELARILYAGRAKNLENMDKPEVVFSVLMAGLEIGLAPNQAIDSIMVSKVGRLSLWGDGALALVISSGLLVNDGLKEWVDGEGEERTGHCVGQRKGGEEKHYKFTIADANRAGLIKRARGKDGTGNGPWVAYPDRMLVMRPRGFFLRDVFPDVLRGLITHEEAMDMEAADTPRVVQVEATVDAKPKQLAEAVPTSGDRGIVITDAGATTAEEMVTTEQLTEIRRLKGLMETAWNENSPTIRAGKWQAVLEEYGVKKASQFTAAKAAEFIAAEGKKHDPFTQPAPSGTSQT